MADAYVDGKVREALVAAKGSRAMAQKLLMTWAAKDDRLLLGMAQPFLKAITGAAIEGVARRGGAGATARPAPRATTSGGLSREALERVLSRIGEDPAPRPAAAPMQVATTIVNRGDGAPKGVSHESAMKAIAKAFVAKKVR